MASSRLYRGCIRGRQNLKLQQYMTSPISSPGSTVDRHDTAGTSNHDSSVCVFSLFYITSLSFHLSIHYTAVIPGTNQCPCRSFTLSRWALPPTTVVLAQNAERGVLHGVFLTYAKVASMDSRSSTAYFAQTTFIFDSRTCS